MARFSVCGKKLRIFQYGKSTAQSEILLQVARDYKGREHEVDIRKITKAAALKTILLFLMESEKNKKTDFYRRIFSL